MKYVNEWIFWAFQPFFPVLLHWYGPFPSPRSWLSSNPLHNPQLCELDRGTVWVSCASVRQDKHLLQPLKIPFSCFKKPSPLISILVCARGLQTPLVYYAEIWDKLKREQNLRLTARETVSAHMGQTVGNGHVATVQGANSNKPQCIIAPLFEGEDLCVGCVVY